MLVRAGIGSIRIIDRDFVEYSNLQRQSLFDEVDAVNGTPKAVAAEAKLRRINESVQIEAIIEDAGPGNIHDLLENVNLTVDGSDNFELRFLLNDYSVSEQRPWFYGAALGSYGISLPIQPPSTPCLRCIFPSIPAAGSGETCETAGIIAPVIHIVAASQVTQVMRYLTGVAVEPEILQVDVWQSEWRKTRLDKPSSDCICCSKRNFEFLKGTRVTGSVLLCGRNAVQISPKQPMSIDLREFAGKFEDSRMLAVNEYLVRINLDQKEVTVFRDGRAIIKGTDDPKLARSLYSRYVGN
jgi:adenylyltransferase/sulfurtransferase